MFKETNNHIHLEKQDHFISGSLLTSLTISYDLEYSYHLYSLAPLLCLSLNAQLIIILKVLCNKIKSYQFHHVVA
jgi:hypothetical protein